MSKVIDKSLKFIMWLVSIIVVLAIAGTFIAGGFTEVIILKMLPLLVHQIVGWILIIVTILGAILSLFK